MANKETSFREYLQRAQKSDACKNREPSNVGTVMPWGYFASPIIKNADMDVYGSSYEHTFEELLPDGSFRKLFSELQQTKGKLLCLDVMGQGGYAKELGAKADVCITLCQVPLFLDSYSHFL